MIEYLRDKGVVPHCVGDTPQGVGSEGPSARIRRIVIGWVTFGGISSRIAKFSQNAQRLHVVRDTHAVLQKPANLYSTKYRQKRGFWPLRGDPPKKGSQLGVLTPRARILRSRSPSSRRMLYTTTLYTSHARLATRVVCTSIHALNT